jgi:hypothetical protein
MTQETNNLAADLWALADLLRGDFRRRTLEFQRSHTTQS